MCTSSSTMCGRESRRRWNLLTGPCLLETLRPGPLQWDDLLLISFHCRAHMHEEQVLKTAPDRIIQPAKYRYIYLDSYHFWRVSSLNAAWKALMLPLLTEGATEEKANACKNWHHPTDHYHWGPQIIQENIDLCIKTHIINMDGKEETGKSWKWSLGQCHRYLLQSKWTLIQLWTWNWQGCCHAMSNQFRVFDITYVALLVKLSDFHDLKIDTNE